MRRRIIEGWPYLFGQVKAVNDLHECISKMFSCMRFRKAEEPNQFRPHMKCLLTILALYLLDPMSGDCNEWECCAI